jgi:hypothetical protein
MNHVAVDAILENAQVITVSGDHSAPKVTISVAVHPVEYSRIVEIAQSSGIPRSEFMALAMYRGVCEIEKEYGGDSVWKMLKSTRRR